MEKIVVVAKGGYVSGRTLTLSDGIRAELDFSVWIERYPYFELLKDADYFKNFSLDSWTVVWPNGADIAPETSYEIALESPQRQMA